MKFCFDIDVRKFFSTFSKNIFRSIQKYFARFSGKFRKSTYISVKEGKVLKITCCYLKEIRRFYQIFKNFPKIWQNIFGSIEKIIFGKVGKFFKHQSRSKICSRIEWEHSQPLKITLRSCLKKNLIIFVLATQNRVPTF